MGIQLDWEIEAEQEQVRQASEDAALRRRRRQARWRALLIILVVLGLFGGAGAAIWLRLRTADEQIETTLRTTVEAEITALRLGDANAFLNIQRSASADWQFVQQSTFDAYQTLKLERDVQLTGRVLAIAVDGMRGRVAVEEIIDGVPYTLVWFYWRYDDGWRHVPADYTFWGDSQTQAGQGVSVRYRQVDTALAQAVVPNVERWLQTGCAILTCSGVQSISIDIVPDPGLALGWSESDPWLLQIPSPYTARARADLPFDINLQLQVANLIAERLVNLIAGAVQPTFPTDAYYLRSAIGSWLVGRFTQINTNSFLIDSLAQTYGEHTIGQLVRVLQPDSNADVINKVTATASLDQTNLDWRDFFTWRLSLENEFINRRDEASLIALYDPAARDFAYQRLNAAVEQRVVVSAVPETSPEGIFQIRATLQIGDDPARQEDALFRLVDGTWRRAN